MGDDGGWLGTAIDWAFKPRMKGAPSQLKAKIRQRRKRERSNRRKGRK